MLRNVRDFLLERLDGGEESAAAAAIGEMGPEGGDKGGEREALNGGDVRLLLLFLSFVDPPKLGLFVFVGLG